MVDEKSVRSNEAVQRSNNATAYNQSMTKFRGAEEEMPGGVSLIADGNILPGEV